MKQQQDIHQQHLLLNCHALLDEVAKAKYGNSLLNKTQQFLIACLEYKVNRNKPNRN
ncbi:MAG: hypothetical protein AAF757_18555 [Cyanobacteria bacterium P01_D01_bin.116]